MTYYQYINISILSYHCCPSWLLHSLASWSTLSRWFFVFLP
jgi:hypothetical protein